MHWDRMTTFKDMEELYSMVTTYAGKILGLQNHIMREGGDADLVVLQDPMFIMQYGIIRSQWL